MCAIASFICRPLVPRLCSVFLCAVLHCSALLCSALRCSTLDPPPQLPRRSLTASTSRQTTNRTTDDEPIPLAAVEDAFWTYGRLLSRGPHPLSPLLLLDAAAADEETARWAALLEQYVNEVVSAEARGRLGIGGGEATAGVLGVAGAGATGAATAAATATATVTTTTVTTTTTTTAKEVWKEAVVTAIMPLFSRQLAAAPAARARVLDSLVCEGPRILFAAAVAMAEVAGAAVKEEESGGGGGAWFLRTTVAGGSAEEQAFLEALQRVLAREEMAPKNFALLAREFGMFGQNGGVDGGGQAAGADATLPGGEQSAAGTKENQCNIS